MSFVRDEDHYCPIIGMSTIASSLSFVTIVLFWCCAQLCLSLLWLTHFMVEDPVHCMCLSVHATLYAFVLVERCSLYRVASGQIHARQKHLAPNKWRSWHDNVRKLSLKFICMPKWVIACSLCFCINLTSRMCYPAYTLFVWPFGSCVYCCIFMNESCKNWRYDEAMPGSLEMTCIIDYKRTRGETECVAWVWCRIEMCHARTVATALST